MTNKIQWKVIQYALGSHPNNLILVGYNSGGMGASQVCAISPLYDLRDMNLDGWASPNEKFWYDGASNIKDPEHVFAFIKEAGKASCVMEAARQLKDWQLYSQAELAILQSVLDIGLQTYIPAVIQNLAIAPITNAAVAAGIANAKEVYGGGLLLLFKIG